MGRCDLWRWGIVQDVEYTKSLISKDRIPQESLFRRLMLYVEVLSYGSGIRLKLLNLSNEGEYDKLENALNKEFINRGQGFMYNQDENLSFYQSIKLLDIRKKINILFWCGDNTVDFSRLKQFKGLEIIFEKSSANRKTLRAAFSEDEEYNRILFIKGLDYIRNNYRNVVAHKDGVSLQTFAEARNIILQTEELLWVFVYLIK